MVDVISDQVEISYAESTTGWSGDSFTIENEIFVQGSNSVAVIQTANGVNDVIFTKASGSWDMSNTTLRQFLSSNIMPNTNTEANDGIQVFAGDGTNTAYWTVGGKDTYSGGWQDFFVNIESTPTTGTVNTAAVTNTGVRINTNTKPRNSTNGWYDNFRFGNGLEINSTTTEAISFTDVATDDALVANQYNILQDTDGVLFAKGKLTLGNSAGAKNCNLVSLNETIFFIDRVVAIDLYGIVGTIGTGTTDIDITGLVCKTVGGTGAELDFSDATLDSFTVKSSTFIDMGAMQFGSGTVDTTGFTGCGTTAIANMAVTNSTWDTSGQITITGTGTITDCNVNTSAASSAVLVVDLDDIVTCHFVGDNTGHAVELNTVGDGNMDWGSTFDTTTYATIDGSTGNETIFVNVGSGLLTINVLAGSTTPTIRTAGATITLVVNPVALNVVVKDTSGNLITSADVNILIEAAAGGSLSVGTDIIKGFTDVNGEISDTRTYVTDQPITGWARKSSGSPFFKQSSIVGTVSKDTGLDLTILLISDE